MGNNSYFYRPTTGPKTRVGECGKIQHFIKLLFFSGSPKNPTMYSENEESIYNLIPKEYQQPGKPPRHTSKFKTSVRTDNQKNKAEHKTMGQAKVPTRAPNDFLKKHEKEPRLPEKDGEKKFEYPDESRKKPPVPKQQDKPIMGLKTTKDFIKQNTVENIMSVPKKPEKYFVDTRGGDKQPLDPSGLEPVYVHRKDYGEVPQYLERRKEDIRKAQEEYDAYVADHFRRGAMKCLSDMERNTILNGLKDNWGQLHHEYQGLSVVTDTAPKKNRKERMEAEMKQLERDIEMIEKHRVIYLAN